MNKKSIWACLLGLSIPAFVVSCADLRDADVCYRAARLLCQKSCVDPDQAHCISQLKAECSSEVDLDEQATKDCSDKLAELDDCAGAVAVQQACSGASVPSGPSGPSSPSSGQYGATCQSSSNCPANGSCDVGVCVRHCTFDSDCSGVSLKGGTTYCDDTKVCSAPCLSSSECPGSLICVDQGGHKSCSNDTTPPQPTTKGLAQSCFSSSECDSTSGLSCQNGFCSKTCRSNSDCGSSTSSAVCAVANGSAANFCTKPCGASACDSGLSCSKLLTVTGATVSGCTPSTTPTVTKTLLGGSCDVSSDCQDTSLSCQQGICTKACTSDAQCSGQTDSGSPARCGALQPRSGVCMAGCSAANDNCDIVTTCTQIITAAGQSAYLCRPDQAPTAASGNVGDACNSASECNQQLGLSCSLGMCTMACSGGTPCPGASSPESSVCVLNSYCSATCDNNGCPANWTCRFDSNFQTDVCEQ